MKTRYNTNIMKIILTLSVIALVLSSPVAFGQQNPLPPRPGRPGFPVNTPGLPANTQVSNEANVANVSLTKFDLDFPGGTPSELVSAIEKASGNPPNAIIPREFADLQLPALKMRNVDVAQLFEALQAASLKTVTYSTTMDYGGMAANQFYQLGGQNQQYQTSYGFRTQGPARDDSVWYFFNEKPNLPEQPRAVRFYQLAPYLETYKVEDITTAIQTAWKMLGETSPPTINFHKDTKLLIAVGEADKLKLIDSVLAQLPPGKAADKDMHQPAKPAKPVSQ
jgi:hypothetical protein